MLDYSQAFERQAHTLGIQSFIENNVRMSLIPTLISFFQRRKLAVKWKNTSSKLVEVTGGGPQGGTAGILEHLSLTKGNLDFLLDDEGYKFIDDSSMLEILNLLSIGLSSFNSKLQVPSDIPPDFKYLPPKNTNMQTFLDKINEWSESHEMKLNPTKTKYMITNFCSSHQFKTRLSINNSLLEQVVETKLLGVIIRDDMSWCENTKSLVKRAYKRMVILRKLVEFQVGTKDMITIYMMFIRSVLEQSSVVWSSSLTQEQLNSLERAQKVALKIIFQEKYTSYENALKLSNLSTLKIRYEQLLMRFAKKCIKNDRTKDILPLNVTTDRLRQHEKYCVPFARKERFRKSTIPTMARMLNNDTK